ncbi:thiamine pyrophosphate-dependent enzyme [Mangrovihabitans endophyticus]|uniref:MFS transporter n=1 Tax=Mangrovihabitans endophyticus TaxID=1751298 RepID=A0A8J3BXJ7_9ACTN|nr:thiamine pyrophosphate-dependent enzyme [Mangrovihabitans endophyticus]GGK88345.1 MFS transporter [Mangrovihabitans endophyticus]
MLVDVTTPQNLDERFRDAVSAMQPPASGRAPGEPVRDGTALTAETALQLFDAQLTSRHLDLAARWLRSFNEGFYTIGSSGHEGNAAVAAAVRSDDPALLHYRSAGFFCARAAAASSIEDAARDVLRGVVASAHEPIAGGRHKVFGRADLSIVPTTSTVASHLPRAVGVAFGITRAPALRGVGSPWPADAIVVASVGDASVNHATALAAMNTAGWHDHRGERLPLLFVCEDNGLGISVPSPAGWVAETLRTRPGLRYTAADGCDLAETFDAARDAAAYVRDQRRPAVLHLSMVRLMGHAGADAEVAYRSSDDIARDRARDPLVGTARLIVEAGLVKPDEVIDRYDEIGWQVRKIAEEVLGEPKLATATEVAGPLAPRRPVRAARTVADTAARATGASAAARTAAFGGKLPEQGGPLTLAQTLNAALTDALAAMPGTLLFGEDVARKGGVYGVTKNLLDRFGPERVFDTLLDETSLLGLGLGAGLTRSRSESKDIPSGILPIPEIQYLAYLHNAEDQLRGEAATLSFFSSGAFRNPMVVRVAGLAYQQNFGGHFHNDNSVAVLRDVPGLVLAVPARPADAAPMLRSCLAAAATDGSLCVFLEPIALYHTRDLYEQGDNEWLAPYAPPADWPAGHVPIGRARTYPVGSAQDLTVLTYGNGLRMSLRVAAQLAEQGYGSRVVDLRWLSPLPTADLVRESAATGRVLIVDEGRRSGGVGEGILAALVDGGFVGAARRIASADSLIPLGPAAQHVLIGEDAITQGAHALLAR